LTPFNTEQPHNPEIKELELKIAENPSNLERPSSNGHKTWLGWSQVEIITSVKCFAYPSTASTVTNNCQFSNRKIVSTELGNSNLNETTTLYEFPQPREWMKFQIWPTEDDNSGSLCGGSITPSLKKIWCRIRLRRDQLFRYEWETLINSSPSLWCRILITFYHEYRIIVNEAGWRYTLQRNWEPIVCTKCSFTNAPADHACKKCK
jgi:hypothetical protein